MIAIPRTLALVIMAIGDTRDTIPAHRELLADTMSIVGYRPTPLAGHPLFVLAQGCLSARTLV